MIHSDYMDTYMDTRNMEADEIREEIAIRQNWLDTTDGYNGAYMRKLARCEHEIAELEKALEVLA